MAPISCLPAPTRTRRRARTSPDADGRPRVPPSQATPKCVFVWCHYCGNGVGDVPVGGACPKCGGHSWERFALSRRLLPDGLGRAR